MPVPLPADLAPAATARKLRRAYRQATQTAANLRADLRARHARTATVAHQSAALLVLDHPAAAAADPARTTRLAATLRLEIELATGPGSPTDPALLAHDTLRLWLLETEAATLASWLPAESVRKTHVSLEPESGAKANRNPDPTKPPSGVGSKPRR